MTKIFIPFKEQFKNKMLSGQKTWTTRSKKYGESGDTFEIFGGTFQLEYVEKMRLGDVVNHYREEGCSSPTQFIRLWNSIHPRKGYNPFDYYWVHFFKLLSIVSYRKKEKA